ncbi:Int2 [Yersinia enterocolitica]|uniref:Uncharacterized protein n=1 Tax=Yersinia enterocolitica TaxID=630 RepID=Q84GR8_YEREN|nr:hypothetical protein [Yersinia enterocolitica]AAN37572.1 unknown [Yersinia enterocolitica]AJI81098.1 hypothetical protein CH47_4249 [Yersinia enterocolitica]EKA25163.1 hypothetical protein YWA314_20727 [Yersinia enterocolitica subsp. enterocolitica WA-314]ELI8285281.1 hypothetical protein [Yersinia enterocolitica]KGA79869.1 hypothetical protein DJ60_4313 [Yersinia enterocolitica]
MSLVTYELAAPSSSYFDFAQAVAIRRMALNLSDQPAYLLESETTLQIPSEEHLSASLPGENVSRLSVAIQW